jgi:hypothetical protein
MDELAWSNGARESSTEREGGTCVPPPVLRHLPTLHSVHLPTGKWTDSTWPNKLSNCTWPVGEVEEEYGFTVTHEVAREDVDEVGVG